MEKRMIITVDGVSASGKSALARLLAERLGFAHLNSGLLYRAAAYLVARESVEPTDETAVTTMLGLHSIELRYDRDRGNEVVIDGIARDGELTTQEISRLASVVAKHPGVRSHFLDIQRRAFAPAGVVAEGRDMGTVIFPHADVKFFVTAPLTVRAERRQRQLAEKGEVVALSELERELDTRDKDDANREVSPMKVADGAVVIENAGRTLAEIVEVMARKVMG